MTTLPRRTLLRGAGGAAIALPLLEVMRPRRALARPAARRFIVFFSGNGTVASQWRPAGGETDFTLSRILQPLEPHRRDIVVIQGLDQQGGGSDNHLNGIGGFLTGAPIVVSSKINPNTGKRVGWAGGMSLDQRLARELGSSTRLRSIELERLHGLRRSILDTTLEQFRQLRRAVDADDRQRLEAHYASIRDLEASLHGPARAAAPGCRKPALPLEFDVTANDNFPHVAELQIGLLVQALSCDLARVASLVFGGAAGGGPSFTWLDIPEQHHALSHEGDSNAGAQEKLTRINQWYAQRFADVISQMKAAKDASGTSLFDSCLLLWGNELGKGNSHSRSDAPYVLAGRADGGLRTGRYLQYTGEVPHNNLLVSLANVMGVPISTFGKREWCSGPLAGLA